MGKNNLNVHWLSLLVILVAIASPWFDISSFTNPLFIKSYVAGIGIGILMLITLWKKHKEGYTTFHISWVKTSWFVLFILGTLSIFWSVNTDFTITKWMVWFIVFCAFVVGYHLKLDEEALIKLCWGLLIAIFIIAAIGILQYLFNFFTFIQSYPPSSTFGNKNISTQPIVLIYPLALFLLFSKRITPKKTWILSTITALIMVFIFYTKTRSSWLSITGEIMLIAGFLLIKRNTLRDFIDWNPNKTKATLFGLGLFLLLINFDKSGWIWSSEIVDITLSRAENSKQGRFATWAVAIDMIKVSPIFGTGLGSWFENEVQGGFGTYNVLARQRVHNDFLELGVELGIVGMVLLLIAIGALNVAVIKILNNNNKTSGLFHFLLWVALSGSFVQMQLTFPYQLAMPSMLLGLYIGFIAKHSEAFIKPIALLRIKTSKLYHQLTQAFRIVLIVVISVIYVDWINTYNTLNDFNKEPKTHLKVRLLEQAIPSIYHLNLQDVLSFMSKTYLNNNKPDVVIKIEEKILDYWPNDNVSLSRYASALIQKKRYKKALEVAKKLKKVSGHGLFNGHFIELKIYLKTKQIEKFNRAFSELLSQDEALLSLNRNTYKLLLKSSISQRNLFKYSEQIYQKYNKYHFFNCIVENTMIFYYVNQKQYKKAKKHIDIINRSHKPKCLDSALLARVVKAQNINKK